MKPLDPLINSKRPLLAAGSIISSGFIASQFARLLSNLVLTRLLVPEMFGVMAIATTLMTGLAMVSDTGIRQYIFRSEDGINPEVLNTAWVMQIIRGLLICLFMGMLAIAFYYFASQGWMSIDSTYADPMLPCVLGALAVCPVLTGLESTKRFELNRKLAMGYIVSIDLASQLLGLVLMIVFAWYYESIWALVAGNILTCLIQSISTHWLLPGHNNSFQWNQSEFSKIYNFSRWILVSSILGYLVLHSDSLWFGAFISAEKLGIYSIGKNLAYVVYGLANKLSISVVLPELSNVAREDSKNLSNSYYRMRSFIDIPAFFIAGILFVTGPLIVDILYDARYQGAGEILKILSLLLLGIGFMQAERCLVALGLVKKRALITGLTALSLNLALPISYLAFDFTGALYAMVIVPIVPITLLNYYLWRNQVFSLARELRYLIIFPVGLALGQMIMQLVEYVR